MGENKAVIPALKTAQDFEQFCAKPGGVELLNDLVSGGNLARRKIQPKLDPKKGRAFLVCAFGAIKLPQLPLEACFKIATIFQSLNLGIQAFVEGLVFCPEDKVLRNQNSGLPEVSFMTASGISLGIEDSIAIKNWLASAYIPTQCEMKEIISVVEVWKRDKAKKVTRVKREEVEVKISPELQPKTRGHDGWGEPKTQTPLAIRELRKDLKIGEILQSSLREDGRLVEVYIPMRMKDRVNRWKFLGYTRCGEIPQSKNPNLDSERPKYKVWWVE